MALIKTIAEIKEVLPKFIPNNLDSKVLPAFDQAEYKYLVPIVGVELYNSIVTKYNGNTLTADDQVLIKRMRLVVCANVFRDEQAFGYLTLTENGIKKFQAKDTTEVRKWEYEKLEAALTATAADGTETLLQYLFEKKPQLWLDSDVYKSINQLLIKTGAEFSGYYRLFQPARTFFAIRTQLKDVQQLYINEGIGSDLLKHLMELVDPSLQLKNYISYIKSALCYLTIKECCAQFSVQFSDAGFTVLNAAMNADLENAGRNSADAQALQLKMDSCDSRGQDFLNLARAELSKYYQSTDASADFKAAFEKGPLKDYTNPADRPTGNERRKIFVL